MDVQMHASIVVTDSEKAKRRIYPSRFFETRDRSFRILDPFFIRDSGIVHTVDGQEKCYSSFLPSTSHFVCFACAVYCTLD